MQWVLFPCSNSVINILCPALEQLLEEKLFCCQGFEQLSHGLFLLQTVVVWNTAQVTRGGSVTVLAKAHTDVDIQAMKIAFFDDTR